jgi:GNAT superfamily N-acetyltransferase
MDIQLADTDEKILKCRDAILALRPHLADADLVSLVKEMINEGYQLAFIEEDGKAAAAIGFRYLQFLFNGKHFYIDDLSTLAEHRGKGYGSALLDYVSDKAKELGFQQITLDSGHHRHNAHRLYLNKGFVINSHHFVKKLN